MKRNKNDREEIAHFCTVSSPIGELLLVAHPSALTGLYFVGRKHTPAAGKRWTMNARHPMLRLAEKQLREYFARKRETFSIPVRLEGTDFQQAIWRQIARIPYGKTISYTELASRAGAPHAIRAAGTSTGRNPISIIVPCHRVVGKNGGMCGFAGGLERKQHLLQFEGLEGKL